MRHVSIRRLLIAFFCYVIVTVWSRSYSAQPQQNYLETNHLEASQLETSHLANGTGGAVASVDAIATQIGIDILKSGGNAVDAAVATAAALGVVEPFSAGIGGGGFMVIYQPANGHQPESVMTLDGREEAPAAVTPNLFVDPNSETAALLPSSPNRMSSGLAVGVPGTPLNWATAVARYGTMPLSELLQPAIEIAEKGFTVDETFNQQVTQNQVRFSAFSSTQSLYLPDGKPPAVGSRLLNPDLAKTYRILAETGINAFYRGEIGEALATTVQNPPTSKNPPFKVWPGQLTTEDLDRYEVRIRPPIKNTYRGYRFYGMGLPSSGGTTVAQVLNTLEPSNLSTRTQAEALHLLIEAERLAFADRNAYIGDPEYVDVPLAGLLNKNYAQERAATLPTQVPAAEKNYVASFGNPLFYQSDPSPSLTAPPASETTTDTEGISTTHLTTIDADGMIVSYTLTIESTGGSGIVVPGYGFILNNELTDFDGVAPHPNVPEPGKRPRSSMAPTIAFGPKGEVLAFGSPGGSTIITTVLNIAVNVIDFGIGLDEAIAAPRLSQRNTGLTQVDQGFETTDLAKQLSEIGHELSPVDEIGAATGILVTPDGQITAVAEPQRRGGGSAMTVR
ncbi:MAG: gamma-glutamyltransferase [Phormidesmis sp.]